MADHLETLGERIRRLRGERRLSLAKVAGGEFSRAFLNQVEMGKSQPSMRILRVIAARLGAPIEYLLDGSSPGIDTQIAIERARLAIAIRRYRVAADSLSEAVKAPWPEGSDARVTLAAALLGLDRRAEAHKLLDEEERIIGKQRDTVRLHALEAGREGRSRSLTVFEHMRLAERGLRIGQGGIALEHYRAARILREAGLAAGPSPASTGSS